MGLGEPKFCKGKYKCKIEFFRGKVRVVSVLNMQSEDPKFKPHPDLVIAGYVFGSSKFKAMLVIANFFGSGVSLKAEAWVPAAVYSNHCTYLQAKLKSKFLKLLSNCSLLLNLLHPCSCKKY